MAFEVLKPLAEVEGDGAEAVQFVLDEQDEPVSDDSEEKPAGLRSVSGASDDSKPLPVTKSDKSDEKTPKNLVRRKKSSDSSKIALLLSAALAQLVEQPPCKR